MPIPLGIRSYLRVESNAAAQPHLRSRTVKRLLHAEAAGQVSGLGPKLAMPYCVMAGEDDSLSDLACTFKRMNNVPGPKTLYVFAGEEHGFGGSPSSQLGTHFFLVMADWLADRAAGKPFRSTYNLIDRTGQMHTEPYGLARTYQYGAPLGVEQLWSEKPPLGVS